MKKQNPSLLTASCIGGVDSKTTTQQLKSAQITRVVFALSLGPSRPDG